jgi:hypothetical protein
VERRIPVIGVALRTELAALAEREGWLDLPAD